MIILGEKYKFTKLDKEKLKKYNIKQIVYNHKNPLDIINQIDIEIQKNKYQFFILNTKATLPKELVEYLNNIHLKGIRFITIEEFLEKYLKKLYIPKDNENVDYLSYLKPYNKLQYIIKRIIDFSVGIPLAILSSPILVYSAYRIKKESPDGPILFKQKRVGKNGEEFVCYKFRSMVPDAEKGKPQFASKDDPRVFKWGAIMRKTRMDEIPQLINVFKAEMHIIGPRPERKYWIEQFEKEIPFYNERHLVAPGITGWAQVCYPYGENVEDAYQKLTYDLYYIKNWSILLEIKTIFKTIGVMIRGKGL